MYKKALYLLLVFQIFEPTKPLDRIRAHKIASFAKNNKEIATLAEFSLLDEKLHQNNEEKAPELSQEELEIIAKVTRKHIIENLKNLFDPNAHHCDIEFLKAIKKKSRKSLSYVLIPLVSTPELEPFFYPSLKDYLFNLVRLSKCLENGHGKHKRPIHIKHGRTASEVVAKEFLTQDAYKNIIELCYEQMVKFSHLPEFCAEVNGILDMFFVYIGFYHQDGEEERYKKLLEDHNARISKAVDQEKP